MYVCRGVLKATQYLPLLPIPNRQTQRQMKHQIATDHDQSKRLLACGLNYKTADMTLSFCNDSFYELMATPFHYGCFNEKDAPAWSLSALLELIPQDLMWQGLYYRFVMGPTENRWEIEYNDLSVINNLHRVIADTPIEACVQMTEWLTANGYTLNTK